MHRLTRYCAGWVAATTLATGVSWVAIQNLVTTAALSQPSLSVPDPAVASGPTGTRTATPTAVRTSAPKAPRVTPQVRRPTTTGAPTRPKNSASRGTPAGSTAASTKPPTVTGYELVGGQIVLELRADAVKLVSAIPAAGYRTETWGDEYWLRVDFVGDERRSSMMVDWYQKAPVVQKTEF